MSIPIIVKRRLSFARDNFKRRVLAYRRNGVENLPMDENDEKKQDELVRRAAIAKRLTAAIKARGRGTQKLLADRCDVTSQAVYHWKTTGIVDPMHWSLIAEILGESVEYLFSVDERRRATSPEASLSARTRKPRIARKMDAYSADQGTADLVHYLPVLTAEQVVMGQRDSSAKVSIHAGNPGEGSFIFIAPDDSLAAGTKPLHAGLYCVIDPTLKLKHGRIALIRVASGTPTLRRIVDDGVGWLFVTDDGRSRNIPLAENVEVIGVMRSASTPPEED